MSTASCRDKPRSVPDPQNVVEASVLAPKLLHDERELTAYLAAFPVQDYKVVDVPRQGKFYLDDIDDAIKNVLRRRQRWEILIDKMLQESIHRGTTVIDVGAHIGTHAVRMSGFVGAPGRVYAFEPQKKIFRELVHNLELNGVKNVVPLRFALGDRAGIVEMNAAVDGNEGGTSVGHGGDRVELRTLDSFGFKNVSVIKIDVEGFEDAVLDGAHDTIRRTRPVLIVEIQGGNDYDTASSEIRAKIDATKRKIAELGYTVKRVGLQDYVGVPR
jgi:FkbM family methyltransferase